MLALKFLGGSIFGPLINAGKSVVAWISGSAEHLLMALLAVACALSAYLAIDRHRAYLDLAAARDNARLWQGAVATAQQSVTRLQDALNGQSAAVARERAQDDARAAAAAANLATAQAAAARGEAAAKRIDADAGQPIAAGCHTNASVLAAKGDL